MTDSSDTKEKLKAIRIRSGLSIRAVAEALDMSASSYGHYEARYKKPYLPLEITIQLTDIFAPHGIDRKEVMDPAGGASSATDDDRDLADQVAEIVRLFISVKGAKKRAIRLEMIRVLLVEDDELADINPKRAGSRQS